MYSWGIFKVTIPISGIITPGYTLCWAAKFLDEDHIYSRNLFDHDEMELYGRIHDLLDEADGVVTYNGDRFDIPQLNRGFVEVGLGRPAPYNKIDLYKVVKKNFKFASNKLDYVCQALGLEGKIPTKGMSLWRDCIDGKEAAWIKMVAYNKQDVRITEQLHNHLLPWIDGYPNYALHSMDKDKLLCPKCGSHRIHKRGLQHSSTQTYQRYQCQDCSSWFRGRYTSVPSNQRNLILTEAK